MRIDPQRLIRLAVLIQHGSFRRAAAQLGVTQPALSQSIAQIEKEVGVKLIERTPHGIEPTVYGQVLYEHAKAVDRELALAAQQIGELAFGHKSGLKIGATAGGAASLVALAVCKLLDSGPRTDILIAEHSSIKSLLTQLHDRTIDMLVCQGPHELELKGTRAISLFRAKRMACIRAGHPLPGDATLRDLAIYPFVCPKDETGQLFGFRQIFSTIGLEVPEILVTDSIHVAKELVLNSDAFALFSDLSILRERQLALIRAIELAPPTQYWMQLILREEQTPTDLIKGLVAEILTVCERLGIDAHADAVKFKKPSRRLAGLTA